MLNRLTIFVYLLSFTPFAFSSTWELEKSEGDMKASCKIHKSGYKMCRMEVDVNHTLHELLAINTDPENLSTWMDTVKTSVQPHKSSESDYVIYMTYDIPYPYYDRDSVTRSIITQDPKTKVVMLKFRSVEGYVPENFELERMASLNGFWRYTPLSPNRTKVEYTLLAQPGGNLVPLLANTKTLEVAWNTITAMIEQLASGKYRDQHLEYIENF